MTLVCQSRAFCRALHELAPSALLTAALLYLCCSQVKPYDPVIAAQFKESRKDFVMDIDRLHDIVYATEQQQQEGDGGSSVDGSSEGSSVVKVKAKYRSKMC